MEKDGYFYGRGTTDNKQGVADLVANFIRLKQEGYRPRRDLILAVTADEESGPANGVDFLMDKHRDWIDAEFCLNTDSGGGEIRKGKNALLAVQSAEKTYLSFRLTARNKGGHSSIPPPENAIYDLAAALIRLPSHPFPIHLTALTKEFFTRSAKLESGSTAADMAAVADPAAAERLAKTLPYWNSLLRTTCVATMLNAGHAENALPQTASATVNCRVIPEETTASVKAHLAQAIQNPKIEIEQITPDRPNPISLIPPAIMQILETETAKMWPGVPVIPIMETGASDGRRLRVGGIPTYGVSSVFEDPDDIRAHGKDERISIKSFDDSVEFYYRLIKAIS
jgi:acetylornithine deacetylase/succinyl-diaminopimelate desuccinylase-like protein